MRCDTPHKEKKFTMKFVQVNPSPFGFEFDEGDYFLICKYKSKKLSTALSQQNHDVTNITVPLALA